MIHLNHPLPPVAEPSPKQKSIPLPAFDYPLLKELCVPIQEPRPTAAQLASCSTLVEKPPPAVDQEPSDVVMSELETPSLPPTVQNAVPPPSLTPLSPNKTPTIITPVAPSEESIELVEAIVKDFQGDASATPEQDNLAEKDLLSDSTPFKRVLSPPTLVESPPEIKETEETSPVPAVSAAPPIPSPPTLPNEEATPIIPDSTGPSMEEQTEQILITPQDIPSLSEAKSTKEALRIVVMTRLLCDQQTREERISPVLLTNRSLAQCMETRRSTSLQELVTEVCDGKRHQERMSTFAGAKSALEQRFKEREAVRLAKVQRLKKEYQILHEKWVQHCAHLDEQSRALTSETETVQPAGRTTRRSAASLGDAVRSDLEMEQIIASLGNDEATDPAHLSLRNLATIPDMISVTHGKVDYVYDDTNHWVESPAEYYGPHTGIHDWTEEEKKVFLDKFAEYPKQFGIIAGYLPNKTQAQCVAFYYLHKKKMIDFRKVVSQYAPNKRRRRGTGKKKGIIADIQQHDAEVSGGVDLLTVPSRVSKGRKTAAQVEGGRKTHNPRRLTVQQEGTPGSTPTPEPPEAPPAPAPTMPVRNSNRRRRGQTQSSGQNGGKEAEEDNAVSFSRVDMMLIGILIII